MNGAFPTRSHASFTHQPFVSSVPNQPLFPPFPFLRFLVQRSRDAREGSPLLPGERCAARGAAPPRAGRPFSCRSLAVLLPGSSCAAPSAAALRAAASAVAARPCGRADPAWSRRRQPRGPPPIPSSRSADARRARRPPTRPAGTGRSFALAVRLPPGGVVGGLLRMCGDAGPERGAPAVAGCAARPGAAAGAPLCGRALLALLSGLSRPGLSPGLSPGLPPAQLAVRGRACRSSPSRPPRPPPARQHRSWAAHVSRGAGARWRAQRLRGRALADAATRALVVAQGHAPRPKAAAGPWAAPPRP